MAKLVSKIYGNALFELALEEDKIDSMLEETLAIKQMFLENIELIKLLNHPRIIKEEKVKIVEKIFKNYLSDNLVGFLTLVVRKDQSTEIIHILDYFVFRVKEYKNIGIAYVTSAVELTDEQKEAVKARLLETTKYVEIEMNYATDQTLVGGMIIRIGDRVIDGTIRNKINELSKNLLKIRLS